METESTNKYYYIIGVRGRVGRNMLPTLSCDFVLKYTTEEIEKVDIAKAMVENELFPTSASEAVDAVELSSLNCSLKAMSLRVRMNPDISVHKFVSDYELEDEWFDMYIKTANMCEDTRKKLIESRIRM